MLVVATSVARSLLVLASLALVACAEGVASDRTEPAPPPPYQPDVYTSSVGPHLAHLQLVESGTITPGVAVSTAMARMNVPGTDIDAIVAALTPHFEWRHARPGHTFEVLRDGAGSVDWFRYRAGPTRIFHAYRDGDGAMRGLAEAVHVRTSTAFVQGTIDHSLYLAMDAAGETPQLTLSFVDLFAWDIDFFTETRKGDRFRLLVLKRSVDGETIGYGNIVAAEYRMAESERVHRAFRHVLANGDAGYYTEDGSAVEKAFLKSPIQFASITSRYGMRRHPILKYARAHRGVDYGAPRGAAIWAVGDGVVRFAGRKGGYGKVVYIRHANGLETRYAHMKGYGKGVKSGRRVAQKQVIGYVGKTGLATGPHLHFEVLRGGRHVNPLTVAVPPAPPIPKAELEAYLEAVAPIVLSLEAGRWDD